MLALAQSGEAGGEQLEALWRAVEARGWLVGAGPRALIQVCGASDSRSIDETVRGLPAFLKGRLGVSQIELLELAGERGSTLPKVTIAPEEALGVVGIAEPVIPLPRCWLEPGFLVTVTNIERDPSARLRGILWAQAEALRAAGGPALRATRVYEAHRLGGSDLAIACGTLDGRSYWLVSPSDVAVDWIAAQAAGLDPTTLPDLRALARHERMPRISCVGEAPALRGLAGAAWRAWLAGAWESGASVVRYVVADARAMRRNVGRVPHAIRRRLPALRRRVGRTA